jgi:2-polyprenyl-6-methoxyphenol hydroxylase-like FAD-dependent oxidoreductase
MGLEDAAALAALFPPGVPADSEEFLKRLELFEKIRKPRAEKLSKMSADRADVYKRNSEHGELFRDRCGSGLISVQGSLILMAKSMDMTLLRSSALR